MAVQKQYHPLLETDDYPTAERVRDAYLEKTEKTRTILEFFAQHNEPYLQKVKMDLTDKTYWRYELTGHRRQPLDHPQTAQAPGDGIDPSAGYSDCHPEKVQGELPRWGTAARNQQPAGIRKRRRASAI